MVNNENEMFNNSNLFANQDINHNNPVGGARTPQYIIVCKDFFESDMETPDSTVGESGTPCLSIKTGAMRLVTYDASGELDGDGKIAFQNPIACLKYGVWGPKIQEYMYNGKQVENIAIHRVSNINNTNIAVQKLEYDKCLIKTYEQVNDTITFSFCFLVLRDIKVLYSSADGTSKGMVAVSFDAAAVKAELKSGS
ncbi:MAG: hypothetical protein LBO73_00920 [Holosporaceae bacterium]|jgi:hypothetical protein|nr:hypothetical protein [Holosporaceae bacterium]